MGVHKGYKPTQEHRKNLSIANRGTDNSGKNNPMFGKHHSEETKLKIRLSKLGKKESEETKKKKSLARLREKNPNWKGGKIISKLGYVLIKSPSHPYCDHHGYVMEHRLFMEKHLGRYLLPKEVIHHINEDTTDNKLENLMLFANNSDHKKYHNQLNKQKTA